MKNVSYTDIKIVTRSSTSRFTDNDRQAVAFI